ncbi:hypothetical protein [Desertimonas flava]|uniref:hypothetical protein n=1 Tax=Desertimonas flava TaxID=2064846 RepID=UPI0013C5293D|nr:hypothetical protein [Desertimonas flava]
MELAVGTRLRSAVCETQIMVVRAPAGVDVDLRCGGVAMLPFDAAAPSAPAPSAPASPAGAGRTGSGTLIGKRYSDRELGLEVLCVKAGEGDLSVGDTVLGLQDAKSLPSSD